LRSGRFDYIVRFAKPDRPIGRRSSGSAAGKVPTRAGRRHRGARPPGRRVHRRRLETLCKKATLLAIAEFQKRRPRRPFVVHQRDFLTVLEGAFNRGFIIMSYTRAHRVDARHLMDKEGRDIVNSVAAAGRLEGKFAQAMENYVDNPIAPTRRPASIAASAESEIENALTYENEQPNIVVLVEQTMVKAGITCGGCRPAARSYQHALHARIT